MNLYIKNFKQFLNESTETKVGGVISYGITDKQFVQTARHNLDTYIENITQRLTAENNSKQVKINYNDPVLLIIVFSATNWTSSDIKDRDDLYDIFSNLTKKESIIGIPSAFVIQESNSEMKFNIPSVNQEGESLDKTPISRNDVYIQVTGNAEVDYMKKVKEKLDPAVQRSNIERMISFGTGLLIQRKKYGGSCITDHGKIIGNIISSSLFSSGT